VFYSHPDRLLREHTADVSEKALAAYRQGLPPDRHSPLLEKLEKIIADCHDFGKYTTFFHRHLNGEHVGEKSYHAEMGAMFGSYVADKMIVAQARSDMLERFASVIVYFVIHRHHGHLINLDQVFKKSDVDWFKPAILFKDAFRAQIADLKKRQHEIEEDIRSYAPDLADFVGPFLNEWETHAEKMLTNFGNLRRYLRNAAYNTDHVSGILFAITIQHVFSLLIDSDKKSAALLAPVTRKALLIEQVEQYRLRHKEHWSATAAHIADKRNRIRDIVMERVRQVDLHQPLHTFTAPTGAGKTLTALEGALLLRKRLQADGSAPRRIIYVLPFTSIIDQNHEVIEDVFCPERSDHSVVLKHHYLSEVEYTAEDLHKEPILEQQLLYIEGWESEIVVTTYVQIMQTLLGVKNRQLKKWHRLRGSIVILDEVQNIPYKYWKLTRELCREHSRLFDTKWVLLTATQPHIFPKEETYEWLESDHYPNRLFFQDMKRTSLHLAATGYLTMDEWLTEAEKLVEGRKSVLIIMNTIRSSLTVYRFFQKKYGRGQVFYLSANLAPIHRKTVLQQIRDRLKASEQDDRPIILVSTQVVEAGVDLDFQRVIRDLGPLDAIIQAAGRCNRHNGPYTGQVFILALRKTPRAKSDASLVYETDADCALNVLKEMSARYPDGIPEACYAELINRYYLEIRNRNDDSESSLRLGQLSGLDFEGLADFNPIQQKVSKFPVFVQLDSDAVELWEYYVREVIHAKDIETKRRNYLRCKAKLHEYTVDVSQRTIQYHKALKEEYGMFLIRKEWVDSNQYYDRHTGIIIDPADEQAFMF
jgi:CRISPR-associated helicase Cas3/CRISPR-associated endonuclease Cas3-HD